jgi:hypothetical protein
VQFHWHIYILACLADLGPGKHNEKVKTIDLLKSVLQVDEMQLRANVETTFIS